MNILLKDIDIYTGDDSKPFIKNGNIGIKDDCIEFIGDASEVDMSFKADKTISGAHKIAMPGLINTHTHCAMTIMRNFANDLELHEWLFNNVFPVEARLTNDDIYWGTMLAAAEMIRTGTTAFADMYLDMEAVARAAKMSGMRANLSISPLKFNAGENGETVDETQKVFEFYKQWNNSCDGKIKMTLEVHSTYLFDKTNLIDAAKMAKQLGVGIQIHISETKREIEESLAKYGKTPVEMCQECGILDVPVIAAHCVHLTDNDMDILKAYDVSVAHNPTSNLKLGSGIAEVPKMLKKGINVTIGTDGPASNNNLNMFEEMHIGSLIHKGISYNSKLVSASDILKMTTSNGAKAIGFEGITGTLKKGAKADVIIIDTNKAHICPVNDPVAALVYSVHGSDVETVIVNGNILMEKGQLTTIDEELVMAKVREIAKRVIKA